MYTYYEVQTSEIFKGNSNSPTVLIREMGGEKDGIGLHVPGTSQFDEGEDVVVLLNEKNSEGSFDVHGMMMGKFNVQTDPDGKEYLIGPGLAEDITAKNTGQSDTTPPQKWTLEALRHLVQSQNTEPKTVEVAVNSAPTPTPSQPAASNEDAAPQLQQYKKEEGAVLPGITPYILVGLGLGAIVWGLRKRSERRKK